MCGGGGVRRRVRDVSESYASMPYSEMRSGLVTHSEYAAQLNAVKFFPG